MFLHLDLRWVLSVLLVLSLFGCHRYDSFKYRTVGMVLSNADNSGDKPIDAGDTVPRLAYAIKMKFSMQQTSSANTDPYESGYQNEDMVTVFNITSPDTINSILPFGSLNSYFNYSTGSSTGALIEPKNYWMMASGGKYDRDSDQTSWNGHHYLMLMDPPAENGMYTFMVDLTFSDGRALSDTISVILN